MKVKSAALPIAIGKYSRIVINLLVNIILSRILTPEDYGVVAVVTVFTTFFISLSDMGLSTAVIQMKDLTKKDIDVVYSFSVYYSIALTVIFALLSGPISNFYGSKDYLWICLLLSVSLFFDAMNTVPNGILNRQKDFKKIAVRTVVVYVISAIVAIILAICGFRFYALVIQSILYSIITYVWNYISILPKFSFKLSRESINKIRSYSSYQFAFNILVYFSRNLDNLLTGKFFGSSELGYYNKAYTLMLYPVNNITNVIAPVLHPVLSDYQKEKRTIYSTFIKINKLLLVIGTVVSSCCFLAADEMIIIAFGAQWVNSIGCFRTLSIAIMFQMINGTTGAIYQALGNTKQLFINGLVNSIVTVVLIFGGIFIGRNILSLAIFVSCAYIIQCILSFFMLIKWGFRYRILHFIKDFIKELGLIFTMVVAVCLYHINLNSIFVSIFVKMAYLFSVAILYLHLTHEDKRLIEIVKK